MFGFIHKPAGFDNGMAFGRCENLRVLRGNVAEFTHCAAVFVINMNGLLQGQVADLDLQNPFQFAADMGVFGFQKVDGGADLTVLGLCKDDDRRFAVPFLTHAAERVARHGEENGVEAVIGAVEL